MVKEDVVDQQNYIPESEAAKMAAEANTLGVAIIGAGPAGMTAALYAARAGLDAVMFERIGFGGQLAQTEMVENYPGFPEGVNGFELAYAMKQQAEVFGAGYIGEEVIGVDFSRTPKVIKTSFGSYEANAVIIASGARARKLGLPLEADLQGKGVSYCATCDGNFFKDKVVAVVGGGNTAVADAIYLSRICKKVYLIHRRDTLRATAIYNDRLSELPNVDILWNAEVRQLIAEDGKLAGIRVERTHEHEMISIPLSGLFIAVGNEPNSEFLKDSVSLDASGYVQTDESGKTDLPGVYAAGDVRTKSLRQVATAIGDGAIVAEDAAEYLATLPLHGID